MVTMYNTPSVQSTHWTLSLVSPTADGEVEREGEGRSEEEEEEKENGRGRLVEKQSKVRAVCLRIEILWHVCISMNIYMGSKHFQPCTLQSSLTGKTHVT